MGRLLCPLLQVSFEADPTPGWLYKLDQSGDSFDQATSSPNMPYMVWCQSKTKCHFVNFRELSLSPLSHGKWPLTQKIKKVQHLFFVFDRFRCI